MKVNSLNLTRAIINLVKSVIPERILFSPSFFLKRYLKEQHKRKDLLEFEIHFADHCNLNCIGCSHFSPLAEKTFLDAAILQRDCERLSVLGKNKIKEIRILGGEPLLHPECSELLDIAGKYFNNGTLNVVTNGILLLKQPLEFWQVCKKYDIRISITKYPVKVDYDGIEKQAKIHDIHLSYFDNTGMVLRSMYCKPLDLQGTQNAEKSFAFCRSASVCPQLKNGKIYMCATIPYIGYFNKQFDQNLEIKVGDFLDIFKIKHIDEILDFLCKPVPFCRYCDTLHTAYGIHWQNSRKDISEWV
jgi:MoaA/NifB/PqqE/SkfB family radical SAM enzyme